MFLDLLAVFVVTLVCPLFFFSTSVHGLPTSPSTLQLIRKHPSIDLSSPTLRLIHHDPIPSVDYDLGGDLSEMLIGESNELSTTDDDTSSHTSSLDVSNEPLKIFRPSSSRKFSLEERQERKRFTPAASSSSLSAPFNLHSTFTDPSHSNNIVNLNQLSEAGRLSPSLKILVETNPFARAWLTMLLQKVMEEQPVPYIFKYGRRRKK